MGDLALPSLPTTVDPAVRKAFEAIRTAWAASVGNLAAASQNGSGAASNYGGFVAGLVQDYSTPPAITGLHVNGAFNQIVLDWDPQTYPSFAYAEVWRASVDDLGQAVMVGKGTDVYADTPPHSDISQTYYYWVRGVSKANVPGPYNGMNGTSGKTADDPAYFLQMLSSEILSGALYQSLTDKVTASLGEALLAAHLLSNETRQIVRDVQVVGENTAASLLQEQVVRAGADSAISADLLTLTARVGGNEANLSAEQVVRAGADSANAANIAALQTTVNGHSTSISTQQSSIDGIQGKFAVKIETDAGTGKKYVAGFGLISEPNEQGAQTSQFGVLADRFWIGAPGHTDVFPFVVDATTGKVIIDTALIKDAAIKSAQIETLGADKIRAVAATIAQTLIGTGHIDNAMIGSFIKSDTYDGNTTDPVAAPGTAGWCIAKGGNAAFQNIYARGNIEASSLKANTAMVNSANIATSIQSDNFVAGSSGWQINRQTGVAEFQNVKVRGDIEASSLKANTADIVSSIHLAGNSVIVPSANTGATANVISGSSLSIVYSTLTLDQISTIFVSFTSTIEQDAYTSVANRRLETYLEVYLNGVWKQTVMVMRSYSNVFPSANGYYYARNSGSCAFSKTFIVAAGTYNVTIAMHSSGPDGTFTGSVNTYNNCLILQGAKKSS